MNWVTIGVAAAVPDSFGNRPYGLPARGAPRSGRSCATCAHPCAFQLINFHRNCRWGVQYVGYSGRTRRHALGRGSLVASATASACAKCRGWDRCCPYLVSTLDLGSIHDRSDTDTDPVWVLRSEIEMLITHEGEGDARREGGEKREGRKGRRKRGRKGGGDCRVKVHVVPYHGSRSTLLH